MSSVTIGMPNQNQQVPPPFIAGGTSSNDTNMMSAVVVNNLGQVVPGGQQQNFTSDELGNWSVPFPNLAITPQGQTYTLKVTKGDFTANVDFILIQG